MVKIEFKIAIQTPAARIIKQPPMFCSVNWELTTCTKIITNEFQRISLLNLSAVPV